MKLFPFSVAPRVVALALLAGVLSAPAGAQRSEVAIREDIEYARGLAVDWRFIDMAEEVLRDVRAAGVSPEMEIELDLVQCQIYDESARFEVRPDRRIALYEKAVEAYTAYIAKNAYHATKAKAERAYVDLSNTYARYLAYRLEESVGEEAATHRARIRELLEKAVRLTRKLIDEIDPENPETTREELRERHQLMLNRGQMYLLIGQIADDAFAFGQASEILTDLAFDAGERTPFGLAAYMDLGRVLVGEGNAEEASGYFEFVMETAVPRAPDQWAKAKEQATASELDTRWSFAQLAAADLVTNRMALGDVSGAVTWSLHFYNAWKREGFALKLQGYQGLMAVARVLLDAGGWVGGDFGSGDLVWYETLQEAIAAGHQPRARRTGLDFALSVAQQVNADNRGNVLQVKAQKLISDIIGRPGANPAPEVLIEAAEGEFNNRDYLAAVERYKRVLAALDRRDAATRSLYGARVYNGIGVSYERLARPLEAALAFREGIERYHGDPQYDPRNAKGFIDRIKEVRRGLTGTDPLIEEQLRLAEQLLERHTPDDAGEVVYNQAVRLYEEGDFGAASERFRQVTADAASYEKALVYAGVCLEKLGRSDEARAELARYVDEYVRDPKRALSSETGKLRRMEALAMARYFLGMIAGKSQDYAAVLQRLATFHADFPSQTSFAPSALRMVVAAHLRGDDVPAAQAAHATMVELFPKDAATGKAAYDIYKLLKERRTAALAAEDTATATELAATMVPYLRVKNETADDPGYAGLREESQLWMDLENWTEAQRLLEDLQRRYGDSTDAEMQQRMRQLVLPDLAEVLLRQHRVQDAVLILTPIMPEDPQRGEPRPTASAIRTYCRALAGWVEGGPDQIVEVPGVGGEANLAKACAWWGQLLSVEENWTAPWYELQFQVAYSYFQLGQSKSSELVNARKVIDAMKEFTGRDFALIAEATGNDVLRRRFVWLDRKVLP